MSVLYRLSLPVKLTLIALLALAFSLAPNLRVLNTGLHSLEDIATERQAISPSLQLLELTDRLQRYRYALLTQAAATENNRLLNIEREIETSFNNLAALPAPLSQLVQELRSRFLSLKEKQTQTGLSTHFNGYSVLIGEVHSLTRDVGAHYGLMLDPSPDAYFLFQAGFLSLPAVNESLARLRDLAALGSEVAANNGFSQRDEISNNALIQLRDSDQALLKVISANAVLSADLAKDRAQLTRNVNDAIALGRLQGSEISRADLLQRMNTVNADIAALNQRVLQQLDLSLQHRADQEQYNLIVSFSVLGLFVLLLIVLLYLISRSILRPMRGVMETAAQIAQGNFSAKFPVIEGKAELAQLSHALDDMRVKLAQVHNNESAALKENLRVRIALDVAKTNVMIADNEYNIVYVNRSLIEMLQQRQESIRRELPNFMVDKVLGSNIDIFHKTPAHQRGLLNHLSHTHEANLQLGGYHFRLLVTPVVDAQNNRLGTVVEWQDMTETLRAQQEAVIYNANMARVKAALDNVTTNVMIADNERNIVYMNNSVKGMLKQAQNDIRRVFPSFDPDRLLGNNMDIFHKNPAHQRDLLADLRTTYRAQIALGGRTFQLIANPVFDEQGVRHGTVVQWLDRTEEVAAEKEVEAIIAAAAAGDFSKRLAAENKEGFFRVLADNINRLVSTSAEGLEDVATVLEHLSRGDLSYRVDDKKYEGVFARLTRNANQTVDSLSALVRQIREATDTINVASREIAQGNQNLSARTEQQAANLQETASSMEEITGTVRQNADNAQQASRLASGASVVASKGGNLMGEVVTTMSAIHESARKIVDIISVIDGIAFQTNILALNAAVEAARAGEQGRGFAVVASEVRSLAQRSATAAKEIKTLIGDSVDKVESGAQLVDEAGQTMSEVVDSVRQVAELMREISAASVEQSSGIEQINQAVTQMDENTQQNAALVEEAAAAAESLEEQANLLSEAVATFRLSASAAWAAAPAPVTARKTVTAPSALPLKQAAPAPMSLPAPPTQKLKAPLTSPPSAADDDWEEF